jgi:hypothetical protein
LIFFVPGARAAILGVSYLILIVAILVAVIGIGYIIFKIIQNKRRVPQIPAAKVYNLNRIEPVVTVSPPSDRQSRYAPPENTARYAPRPAPQSPKPEPIRTSDLVARLRAIDWYQFEKIVAITERALK